MAKNITRGIMIFSLIMTLVIVCAKDPYTEADTTVIKAYIMDEISLTQKEINHLDVNRDGNISPVDYVMIKNRIKKGSENDGKNE